MAIEDNVAGDKYSGLHYGSGLRRQNSITKLEDGLQRAQGGDTVVLLFAFRQFVVGDEAGVLFCFVVTLRPEGPTLSEPLRGPKIVGVFGKTFGQREQFLGQGGALGVDWFWLVTHARDTTATRWDVKWDLDCGSVAWFHPNVPAARAAVGDHGGAERPEHRLGQARRRNL